MVDGSLGDFDWDKQPPTALDIWKKRLRPMGSKRKIIPFKFLLTEKDIEKMLGGLVPENMEDKWIGFLHNTPSLDFYRSWTGYHIYHLPIRAQGEFFILGPLHVVDDPRVMEPCDDQYHYDMVHFLLKRIMLENLI